MRNAWAIASVLVMAGVAFAAPPPVPTANGTNILQANPNATVKGTLPQVPIVTGAPSAPEFQFGVIGMEFDHDGQAITACFQSLAIQALENVGACFSVDSPDSDAKMNVEMWQINCQYDPPGLNNANQNDAKRNTVYGVTGQTSDAAVVTGSGAACVSFHADALFTSQLTGSTATNGLLVRVTWNSAATGTAQLMFKANRAQ